MYMTRWEGVKKSENFPEVSPLDAVDKGVNQAEDRRAHDVVHVGVLVVSQVPGHVLQHHLAEIRRSSLSSGSWESLDAFPFCSLNYSSIIFLVDTARRAGLFDLR